MPSFLTPPPASWQDISPGLRHRQWLHSGIESVDRPRYPASYGASWAPALLLPNGNVFFVGGGTSNTALYNPSTNTWSSGPSIPFPYTADDAPGRGASQRRRDLHGRCRPHQRSVHRTDRVLRLLSRQAAGTITQLTGSNVPADPALAYGSYVDRMLMLPTGQLMFSDARLRSDLGGHAQRFAASSVAAGRQQDHRQRRTSTR